MAHDGLKLTEAVTAAVEGLFAHQRGDGTFAPSHSRYSPAHSALALIALHLTSPEDPDGLIARGIAQLCRSQRFDGGWASHHFGSEVLPTALAADALRLIDPVRAAPAIEAAGRLLSRIGRPEDTLIATPVSGSRTAPRARAATRWAHVPPLPVQPDGAVRRLGLRLPAFTELVLGSEPHHRDRSVHRALRARARSSAAALVRQIYEREGATGSFAADPMLTSQICIGLVRSGLAPDIVRASVGWLREVSSVEGGWSHAPLAVRWTSLASSALTAAGVGGDPRLAHTVAALSRAQQTRFSALGIPAGGWCSAGTPGWPTVLDTAETVTALSGLPAAEHWTSMRQGADWLRSQQSSAGSWSFAVHGIAPGDRIPCAQLTARAVCALIAAGAPAGSAQVRKALRWLDKQQERTGAFKAMWYRGSTIATGSVVEAYARAGAKSSVTFRRGFDWLLATQREDGSWSAGESVGVSTVEETSVALRALLAAGLPVYAPEALRAARWLLHRQRTDGMWRGEPVHEHVRLQYRYADDLMATALALRALGALCTPAHGAAK
ncbi:prenyltransferase/squalene oxidase repeat-containing protein [Streptomyces galbus]|uniref:prenyltransferase/squalene oxidase repeat-containing protein n=1 Tax=Streptomyces galbus TaxID=33898 RepID=UPI003810FB8D